MRIGQKVKRISDILRDDNLSETKEATKPHAGTVTGLYRCKNPAIWMTDARSVGRKLWCTVRCGFTVM